MSKFLIKTDFELNEVFERHVKGHVGYVSLDTETSGLHPIKDWVVGYSFAIDNNAWYVPLNHENVKDDTCITFEAARDFLAKLSSPTRKLVFHNALFDLSLIYRTFGIVLLAIHDTMAMAYVTGESFLSLKKLTAKYFNVIQTEYKDLMISQFGRQWKAKGFHFQHLSPYVAFDYACDDAIFTLKLLPFLQKNVRLLNCEGIYKLELMMIPPTMAMNFTGIRIDVPMLKQAALKFIQMNKEREKAIYDLAGHTFNIAAPKDVCQVLFTELQLPIVKRSRKTGVPSTDAEVMKTLEPHHPIVPLIALWRSHTKLGKSYAEKIPKSVETNGRIYALFHSIGSVSGRLVSRSAEAHDNIKYGMNFQNVALKTFELETKVPHLVPPDILPFVKDDSRRLYEYKQLGCTPCPLMAPDAVLLNVIFDADVRTAFIPDDDSVWCKADYSQIEYRVMAALSGEDELIDGFKAGVDYHTQTASIMLGKPVQDITKAERKLGKILNFGLSYGMSIYTLAKRTGMSEAEAQAKYDYYFGRLPKLQTFIQAAKDFAARNGFIRTFFGRVRYLPIGNVHPKVRAAILRQAFNTVIQGTAADILKIGTVRVHKVLNGFAPEVVKRLLTVHDELDFEVNKSHTDTIFGTIKHAMEIEVPDNWPPIIADLEIGKSWGQFDLKEYTVQRPVPKKSFTSWPDVLSNYSLV